MKCPVTNYQEDKIKANAIAMLGKLRKIVNPALSKRDV
jgi:hypothetical protein